MVCPAEGALGPVGAALTSQCLTTASLPIQFSVGMGICLSNRVWLGSDIGEGARVLSVRVVGLIVLTSCLRLVLKSKQKNTSYCFICELAFWCPFQLVLRVALFRAILTKVSHFSVNA